MVGLGPINHNSDLVGPLDWWVDGKLDLLILGCIWLLASGDVSASVVPLPVVSVFGVLEPDGADRSIMAAPIASLLQSHVSEGVVVVPWHVHLPPLGRPLLLVKVMHSSWRVKLWVLPIVVPIRLCLERCAQLQHCQLGWLHHLCRLFVGVCGVMDDIEMLLKLFDLSMNIIDVIKIGLMLSLGSFADESINLILSFLQEGGGDHVWIISLLSQRLLQGGNFGQDALFTNWSL